VRLTVSRSVDTNPSGLQQPRARSVTTGKQVYFDEFKRSAVEQVVVHRHTMSSVAKLLAINYQSLRQWVLAAKVASSASTVPAELPTQLRLRYGSLR